MKSLRSLSACCTLLLISSATLAHPGHGIGQLGHALDHVLWNFLGFAAGGAALLLIARLPDSIKRRSDEDKRD